MNNSSTEPKIIAIVSGKGGSGKTMISAAIAMIFCRFHSSPHTDYSVLLIDGDLGTGGLTNYLSINETARPGGGLSQILVEKTSIDIDKLTSKIHGIPGATLLGVGDLRKFREVGNSERISTNLENIIRDAQVKFGTIIVDCRGGIDAESLAVCRVASDILLVTELDPTSFQATRYVSDVLSDCGLRNKLCGFIINKVFSDPSAVAHHGAFDFRCRYLGAIPFDFDSARCFLRGELPGLGGGFGSQLYLAITRAFPDMVTAMDFRRWSPSEFAKVGVLELESVRGGLVIAGSIILLATVALSEAWLKPKLSSGNPEVVGAMIYFVVIALAIGGVAGTLEPVRRTIGRAMRLYMRAAVFVTEAIVGKIIK